MSTYKLSVVLLMLVAFSVRAHDDVHEIVNAYISKMGGAAHWEKLQSWKRTSHRKNGLTVTSYAKKPDQFQLVFRYKGKEVIKSYDGREGWLTVNGGYQSMRPGEEIEMAEEPEFYEELITAQEKGYELVLEGREKIGSLQCFKLKMTKSDTDVQWYWINTKNYLLEMVGEYSEDPEHAGIFYTTRFEDYRDVDGYLIPFTEHLIRNGTDTTSIYYTEMKVNPEIDDSLFRYQPTSVRNGIAWMQDVFADSYLPAYTFVQETITWTDEKVDTSIWYETIRFPDGFRIDFIAPLSGITNLNLGDTLYAFRGHELRARLYEPHPFLVLEGGMYTMSTDAAMNRLQSMSIDTSAFYTCQYKDEAVLVFGANDPGAKNKKQVWISMKTGKILRSFEYMEDQKELEMRIDAFQTVGDQVIPKHISFYFDGERVQTETYVEVNIEPEIPDDFFRTDVLSKEHWSKASPHE